MTALSVDDDGCGPAVVLLHGFSFDRSMWDPQHAALLSAGYRVIRYDLRGFGASGPPAADRDHVGDLWEVLDAHEIGAAHIVGLSLGANIALAAGYQRPTRVTSLTLASPGLPGHVWRTPRPPDEAASHARVHGVPAGKAFWLTHPLFASLGDHPEAHEHVRRMVAAFPAYQWRDGPTTPPLPALAETLAEVTPPALVVSGALDAPGYREIAEVLGSGLPNVRRHELPGTGHVLNLERPAEVSQLLLGFLREVGVRNRH
jgi:pimeloyl-ACP methyl ester carboxylesterase